MKKIVGIIVIFFTSFLLSCSGTDEIPIDDNISNNIIENFNIEITLDSIIKVNNSRANAMSSVFLISKTNNNFLEFPLVNNSIKMCVSIKNDNIYVSFNGKSIKANGDNFVLSTISSLNYKLSKSIETTPNGRLTYDLPNDILISDNIKFTKSKNNNIFFNGEKIDGRKITIDLNRLSFKLSTTVFVCDMSEIVVHKFDANEFKKSGLGDISEWQCQFYISSIPKQYDLTKFNYKKLPNGNDILSLSSKMGVKEIYKKFIIQLFPTINLGSYLGIGNSVVNLDVMPFDTNGSRLCYSFYHNGIFNTLTIPLDGKNDDGSPFKYHKIDFNSNEDWDINVIFDKHDFIKQMKDAKSRGITNNILDIPYKLIINKN